MIKRDRELLARVAAMNTKLGLVVVTLVDQQWRRVAGRRIA
ncbi:MAG: hypothetical protein ACRDSE_13755 [Pseudonocardiaceae bacterium]